MITVVEQVANVPVFLNRRSNGDDIIKKLEQDNEKLQAMVESHKATIDTYRDEATWAIGFDADIAECDEQAANDNWLELMQCGSVIVDYAIKDWAYLPGSGTFLFRGHKIGRKPVPDAKSATMYRLEVLD